MEVPKVQYTVGEEVKINDGPFANLNGRIDEIDPDRGKLKISVSIFGRFHARSSSNTVAGPEEHRITPVTRNALLLMAKKIQGYIRLQLPAGAANPAPPVGPALGAQGVNIAGVLQGSSTPRPGDQNGMILPVVITVFSDKSFTFILKSPPASVHHLERKAANIASGSARPNQEPRSAR